ncbi:hypothetical protein DYBT9275_00302 [Dyadobacter sp. CECT 9275]|uniref:Acetyl xylan esterase domain-containing protein n=1 Tax=Dyadobacter helix TaxID=2822344 RepID=A0A916J769_9BACT|nr:acetylxylan esterase [Dyadobacter sp. CECT 9275]CAG4989494.1 hypothetical protein DYBT9275_00302 [Dyadobacter sp. CECT 9275]
MIPSLLKIKRTFIILVLFLSGSVHAFCCFITVPDSLPGVFNAEKVDLTEKALRYKASVQYQKCMLPQTPDELKAYLKKVREKVILKSGVVITPDLPLHYQETGSRQLSGYTIKNVTFQAREGIYTTANLYVPDGKGKFPAVIAMHGHWADGKTNPVVQALGHTLALNGYVCLVVDAWGAGERTTEHGVQEYHGANLGASLLNIGETLLGAQLSDNIRGVDLLTSLPYVNPEKIGATGASGGGNQTMWLAAIDQRIKAAMPVVSVGTFESYIMRSNCVCELLPEGLTFTEEAGILGLIAPRALKICNALHDSNPTFMPAEMLRSYENVKPVFALHNAYDKLSYQLFNTGHGYWPDMRETMVGWFDLELAGKGSGMPKKEIPFDLQPDWSLMVYPKGQRVKNVMGIAEHCRNTGAVLKSATVEANADKKRSELRQLIKLGELPDVKEANTIETVKGWERVVLETSDNRLIPVLYHAPGKGVSEVSVVLNPKGKELITADTYENLLLAGKGVLVLDLWGTGEVASQSAATFDKGLVAFHTLSRASLWLGSTVMAEWVKDLAIAVKYVRSQNKGIVVSVVAEKEAGVAALIYASLEGKIERIDLKATPVSYVFDQRETIDYYSMAIHIPGFLKWGDVSLLTALSNTKVSFSDSRSMSGRKTSEKELLQYRQEYSGYIKDFKSNAYADFR